MGDSGADWNELNGSCESPGAVLVLGQGRDTMQQSLLALSPLLKPTFLKALLDPVTCPGQSWQGTSSAPSLVLSDPPSPALLSLPSQTALVSSPSCWELFKPFSFWAALLLLLGSHPMAP